MSHLPEFWWKEWKEGVRKEGKEANIIAYFALHSFIQRPAYWLSHQGQRPKRLRLLHIGIHMAPKPRTPSSSPIVPFSHYQGNLLYLQTAQWPARRLECNVHVNKVSTQKLRTKTTAVKSDARTVILHRPTFLLVMAYWHGEHIQVM
jgi:hypothetical protein